MKKVLILKADYDNLVYPAVAMALGENVSELRIASKVLTKLEARGKHAPIPPITATLCEHCRTQFTSADIKPPAAMFELDGISDHFVFEDSEAEYLVQQLKTWIPKLPARQARAMIPIIDALEKEYNEVGVTKDSKVSATVDS